MGKVWSTNPALRQTDRPSPRVGVVITAFVSISADPSDIAKLGAAIADIEGVREVHSTTGDHDLLVILWVRSHDDVATIVTEKICRLAGVKSTRTSIAFRSYGSADTASI